MRIRMALVIVVSAWLPSLVLYPAQGSLPRAAQLRVGSAAVLLTPYGQHPDWDGTITGSGIWGERFTDLNANGKWDTGEPFEDDRGNTELDASSANKYDGIYLAGFGNRRLATGKHDDLWARTLVLDNGQTRFAIVSVDFIGYYSSSPYYGISHISKLVDPRLGIQEILVASTHNHEGPDTIGAWGNGSLSDGKYPKYLRFVDRQIAKSIALASRGLTPVRIRLGRTDPRLSPSIAGMQTRTRGRPPSVFDDELRVMQFVGTGGAQRGKTIATLVNWNTHPESMEDKNTALTSDFPHSVRAEVEARYGGVALYISGAIGAVEIIGDSNTRSSDRSVFDGKEFPLSTGNRPAFTFERTEAIGRDISKAVFDAIGQGQWSGSLSLELRKADLSGPMDNPGYALLSKIGVLDTIGPVLDGEVPKFSTWIYALRIGDAQIVTTPGELLPEIFLGLSKFKRTDCPEADTGLPLEPGIREHMSGSYRFVFGLCPDEFGYIVPSYDWRREPFDPQKMEIRPAVDPCSAKGVPGHYHETNSASSILAPASTCVTIALLTGKRPTGKGCEAANLYSEYVRRLP